MFIPVLKATELSRTNHFRRTNPPESDFNSTKAAMNLHRGF